MGHGDQFEREVRAARNQGLFRAVNEKMKGLNEAFAVASSTLRIVCECADQACIEIIEISTDDYAAVRAEPRRFVVLPGHVYPDVEVVLEETSRFAIVEEDRVCGGSRRVARVEGDDTVFAPPLRSS